MIATRSARQTTSVARLLVCCAALDWSAGAAADAFSAPGAGVWSAQDGHNLNRRYVYSNHGYNRLAANLGSLTNGIARMSPLHHYQSSSLPFDTIEIDLSDDSHAAPRRPSHPSSPRSDSAHRKPHTSSRHPPLTHPPHANQPGTAAAVPKTVAVETAAAEPKRAAETAGEAAETAEEAAAADGAAPEVRTPGGSALSGGSRKETGPGVGEEEVRGAGVPDLMSYLFNLSPGAVKTSTHFEYGRVHDREEKWPGPASLAYGEARKFFGNFRFPKNKEEFDYIVIGGGGAGCPLARTLAERGFKTLLVERGSFRDAHQLTWLKKYVARVSNDEAVAQPVVTTDGVITHVARVMGGGTSVNFGVYIEEEDAFVEALGFDLERFKAASKWVRARVASPSEQTEPRYADALHAYFSELARNDTLPEPSARMTPGGAWNPYNLFDANGFRRSADTLLGGVGKDFPRLLTVSTETVATKIEFREDAAGRKVATCVQLRAASATDRMPVLGKLKSAFNVFQNYNNFRSWLEWYPHVSFLADRLLPRRALKHPPATHQVCLSWRDTQGEIVLSAGAILTPWLLFQSGVGPAHVLKQLKVAKPVLHAEHLGANLGDRPFAAIAYFFDDRIQKRPEGVVRVAALTNLTYHDLVSDLSRTFAPQTTHHRLGLQRLSAETAAAAQSDPATHDPATYDPASHDQASHDTLEVYGDPAPDASPAPRLAASARDSGDRDRSPEGSSEHAALSWIEEALQAADGAAGPDAQSAAPSAGAGAGARSHETQRRPGGNPEAEAEDDSSESLSLRLVLELQKLIAHGGGRESEGTTAERERRTRAVSQSFDYATALAPKRELAAQGARTPDAEDGQGSRGDQGALGAENVRVDQGGPGGEHLGGGQEGLGAEGVQGAPAVPGSPAADGSSAVPAADDASALQGSTGVGLDEFPVETLPAEAAANRTKSVAELVFESTPHDAAYEELSGGHFAEGAVMGMRQFLPPAFRSSIFVDLAMEVMTQCSVEDALRRRAAERGELAPPLLMLCPLVRPVLHCFERAAAHAWLLPQPRSRGFVGVGGPDGRSMTVTANYLKDPVDLANAAKGLAWLIHRSNQTRVFDTILERWDEEVPVSRVLDDKCPLIVRTKLAALLGKISATLQTLIPSRAYSLMEAAAAEGAEGPQHEEVVTRQDEETIDALKRQVAAIVAKGGLASEAEWDEQLDPSAPDAGPLPESALDAIPDGGVGGPDAAQQAGEGVGPTVQRAGEAANRGPRGQRYLSYPPGLPSPNRARDVGRLAQRLFSSMWHWHGSAALGLVTDAKTFAFMPDSVLRLSIVDASVVPRLTRANPQAFVMAMGRYAGDVKASARGH